MSGAGVVLSLCDKTGNAVKPWAAAGHQCICLDLQHAGETTEGNITRIGADVRSWIPPNTDYAIVLAFPPCTHTAVSGARWFKGKGLGKLIEALQVVEACKRICEWSGAPWMLENPVSTISTYWRKPDHSFNPCDYAGYLATPADDAYTKKTCLWTGAGFQMPATRGVFPSDGSRMHLMAPSEDRSDLRSASPMGFSTAVFEANSPLRLKTAGL